MSDSHFLSLIPGTHAVSWVLYDGEWFFDPGPIATPFRQDTCNDQKSRGLIFINSLVPGRCGSNSKCIIFVLIIQNSSLGTRYEIVPRWMTENLINEKLTLVQVMACCCQATSHHHVIMRKKKWSIKCSKMKTIYFKLSHWLSCVRDTIVYH